MKITKELVESMGFKYDLIYNRFIRMDGTEMLPLAEGEWGFINRYNQKSIVRSLLEVVNLIRDSAIEEGVNQEKLRVLTLFRQIGLQL